MNRATFASTFLYFALSFPQEDETQRRILDRLVSWLQPCLDQSREEWSAVDSRDLWHRHFGHDPPECVMISNVEFPNSVSISSSLPGSPLFCTSGSSLLSTKLLNKLVA